MPQHTSAVLLTDGEGQPIPQYLDTADKTASPQGTFKPLTKHQPVQLESSNIPGGLPVNIQGAEITVGSVVLEDVQSKTKAFTFHEAQTVMSEGNPFPVEAYKTLTIEIYGSSTARSVHFYGVSASGVKRPIQGVNMMDLSFATNTTGTGEFWLLDITGLETIYVELSSVTGGNVTVKGKAVA